MKLKIILILLLILQVGSCTKRYANLKKIRVSNSGKTESDKIKKRSTGMLEINPLETASIDSTPNLVQTPSLFRLKEKQIDCKQNQPPPPQHKKTIPSKQLKHSQQKIQPAPAKEPKNFTALLAFLYAVGAFAFIPLFLVFPFGAALIIVILAALARHYGQESYAELKGTANKRKWMALWGMILGTILFAFALVAILISIPFLLFYGSIDEAAIILITIFGTIIASTMLLISFFSVKEEPQKSVESEKQNAPQSLAGTNKYANLAFSLLIVALLSLFFIIAFPPLQILTILCFLAAIVFGIIAIKQIKSTHEDGLWMALIATFLLPSLLVIASPLLLIPIALGYVIWKLIKRNKLKKVNTVSLS